MITRLGVLSDTHGRTASCRRAVTRLRDAGAEALVHLGDVGSPAVLEELVGETPAHVVFGNCDDDRELGHYAECLGLIMDHPLGRISVAGRSVAFTHGHLSHLLSESIGHDDLLLVGHTHLLNHDLVAGTRIVNPGALFRASRYTCCLIEGSDLRVSWIDVGREPLG